MLARKPRKFDYNLSPIRPLRDLKELKNVKMGCASSQVAASGTVAGPEDGTSQAAEPTKYPPAECFEIPLDDEGEQVDSIIKKHPPKRLQRLTEVPVAPTTIEDLEEKLAKAEIRRKNFLQQKIEGLTSLTKSRDADSNSAQPDAPGDQDAEKDQVQAQDDGGGPNGNPESDATLANGGAQG